MFTGLIEAVGHIVESRPTSLAIEAAPFADQLRVGDSVAVSGVCLTVTSAQAGRFVADVSPETLSKTTLGGLRPGQVVNLESALTLAKPLGGHLLQGHVDCVGTVQHLRQDRNAWLLGVDFPAEFNHLVVGRASIGVDGVSLTVTELEPNGVRIAVIPHTVRQTTIAGYTPGAPVNLEFDILGKYVARYLEIILHQKPSTLTVERLRELGF